MINDWLVKTFTLSATANNQTTIIRFKLNEIPKIDNLEIPKEIKEILKKKLLDFLYQIDELTFLLDETASLIREKQNNQAFIGWIKICRTLDCLQADELQDRLLSIGKEISANFSIETVKTLMALADFV